MTNPLVSSPVSTPHEVLSGKPDFIGNVLKGLPTLLVLAVMGCGWIVMHNINSGAHSSEDVVEISVQSAPSGTLVLPKGKLEAA